MRIRRSILVAIGCLILGACVVWATFARSTASPSVSMSFQGYSGDSAVFSVFNNDFCDISFGSWSIMYHDAWSQGQVSCSVSGARLKHGASCTAKVRVGPASGGWRVRTLVQRHTPKQWLSGVVCSVPFCQTIGIRLMDPPVILVSPHITR